jgi:PAS domain S-box-containing protein
MMSLTPSSAAVLNKIAELAASKAPVLDRLEQVLGTVREALGLGSLSVVAAGAGPDDLKTWHSSADGFPLDASTIQRQALDLIHGRGESATGVGLKLPDVNGYKAALIGLGDSKAADLAFLEAASGFISILVENLHLAEAVQNNKELSNRRMEEIAAIYDIGQAIDATHPKNVLDMIVRKAAAVMDAQACSLMLRDPRDGCLVIEASFGIDDTIAKNARVSLGEGVAGKVLETGEPTLICDIGSDSRFAGGVRARPGICASMCVPLKNEDGAAMGVLNIRRHEPKPPFTQDDLTLFSIFAAHASLAISNAGLYSRLHRKVHEMATISDVMRAINSTLDLDRVLDQIVDSITEVVGFDRCCLYLLDAQTNELVAGARKGYSRDAAVKDRIKFGEGVTGLAAKEQIPIFSQGSPIESEGMDRKGEFLAAPIMVRDQCIGVVVVDNCVLNRPIEPQHVELLATFVSQAGIAVENARLYEAMEQKYAEMNVLYEHSRGISAAYGLENAAETLVQAVEKVVRCDGAAVLLLDTKRGRLKLQASSGGAARKPEELDRIAAEERCVNYVRNLGTPVLLGSDTAERTQGANSDLLNAIAPAKSNLMLAPLVVEDTTIGVLALYRGRTQEFQGSELKLISILTSHAAVVLKNAISYEQKMRQKVLELTALYEFSKRISSAANLEEALDSILAIVGDLVDYDEAFIYVIDQEREVAIVNAARLRGNAAHGGEIAPAEEPLDGSSVTSWAIKERKALVTPDIGRDDRFSGWTKTSRAVRSLMSIPLIVQDDVVGVLNVHSYSPNQYSEDDVRTVSIVASQGAAIYKELEALSALTSYTDNILGSIAAGVVTLDSDGLILTWNTAAYDIVGIPAMRVVGQHYRTLLRRLDVTDADKDLLDKAITGVAEGGETYQGYKLCLHSARRDQVFVNMNISPLVNAAGEQLGLVIIFEDITSGIKMENEFRRMGELAAIGQLAASIAHELRNPLSSIKGAAQFLRKEYEDHSSVVEFLDIIVEEVNGLNKLTTDFLDFARPMQFDLKPTDVSRVVEKTLQLMSIHITDSNVVVKEALARDLPSIQADPKQLEQVLKNMFINALQAMPEGGVLQVETGVVPSGGVYFSVSDTGIGIDQDKLDRIFLPFVTTKTKGTGLGLSIVNRIVENHGGRIEVTSEPGSGATFKVYLPLVGPPPVAAPEIDQTLDRRTSGQLKWGGLD